MHRIRQFIRALRFEVRTCAILHLAASGESSASHRGRRCARLARRDEREYWDDLNEEQRSQTGSNPGAERLFSAWMEGQIAYRGLPGIVVGVVSDQEVVWARGFGFADINAKLPMTATTKFRMASHSKLFTAIAIMQLREEGKVRLDDPVAK